MLASCNAAHDVLYSAGLCHYRDSLCTHRTQNIALLSSLLEFCELLFALTIILLSKVCPHVKCRCCTSGLVCAIGHAPRVLHFSDFITCLTHFMEGASPMKNNMI